MVGGVSWSIFNRRFGGTQYIFRHSKNCVRRHGLRPKGRSTAFLRNICKLLMWRKYFRSLEMGLCDKLLPTQQTQCHIWVLFAVKHPKSKIWRPRLGTEFNRFQFTEVKDTGHPETPVRQLYGPVARCFGKNSSCCGKCFRPCSRYR